MRNRFQYSAITAKFVKHFPAKRVVMPGVAHRQHRYLNTGRRILIDRHVAVHNQHKLTMPFIPSVTFFTITVKPLVLHR